MKIERKEVFELLRQVPLFSQLNDPKLDILSALFQLELFHDGEIIFEAGDPSEVMYLIFEGKVRLLAEDEKRTTLSAKLKRGDVFGEEALLFDDPRFYQAIAEGDLILLRWTAASFLVHHHELEGLDERLEVMINSRELSTRVRLPWLQDDEYVHVMTRRHSAILWQRLIAPIIVGLISITLSAFLNWVWLPGSPAGWILMILSIVIALAWVTWDYFDWRNDYFIITNKRVVWIEKVALIYESRQEAPLRTIMSVGMQRTRVGTVLDFADVVVMTYVGTIRLQDLRHAETIASLVEGYWHHAENQSRQDEAQAIARKLHEKLDFPLTEAEQTEVRTPAPLTSKQPPTRKEPGFLGWLFSDFIRLRYESDGVITYRKHWFILIKKTWLPALLMLLGFAGLAARMGGLLSFIPLTAGIAIFLMFIFLFFVWVVYQYADWRNDQFKLTLDQIIDIDRKPLGKIRQRSAPLENVLSIEYQRLGFWGFLFNFGTVFIAVGNMKLTFDYVFNPSEVQQDIFYRMGERLETIRQFEIDSERERMSEWIASYHQKMRNLYGRGVASDDSETKKV
jgi:hypothetical protein